MRVFPVSWSILLLLLFFPSSVRAEEYLDSGNWGPDAQAEPEATETPKEAVKEEENEETKEEPKPEAKEEKPPEETLEPAPAKPAPPSPSSEDSEYEKEWEYVEYDIFDEIIPFEKRIALLKKFMETHPGDHPHKKEAEYYLPLLEQHKEPRNHPFDKKRVPESKMLTPVREPYDPSRTEWAGLRVMGGQFGFGAMVSLITLRCPFLYWSSLRVGLSANFGLIWVVGTQFGLQFQLDRDRIHEIRLGTGVLAVGLGYDSAFLFPIWDVELSYSYRIRKYLSVEAGLELWPIITPDFRYFPPPMGFVGLRF